MNIFEDNNGLVLSLDNMSKSAINEIANRIVTNVSDGHTNALQEYIKAKGLSELSDIIVSGIKDLAIDEASKYEDGASVLGCKFQVKSLSDSYDFSNDDEWNLLNQELTRIKDRMKQREKQMIEAMNYSEIVDKNGEIIPSAILKKRGGKTIAITIPK
jgi:chemotaxis protein CheY-P-specific phosphatase CheC